jgi:hypothetical protein
VGGSWAAAIRLSQPGQPVGHSSVRWSASQPASQPAMQPTRFKHVQWLFVFGIGCSTVARVMHLKWYVGERKHRVQVASNRVIECSTDARIMF